jgi:hypothetical protein
MRDVQAGIGRFAFDSRCCHVDAGLDGSNGSPWAWRTRAEVDRSALPRNCRCSKKAGSSPGFYFWCYFGTVHGVFRDMPHAKKRRNDLHLTPSFRRGNCTLHSVLNAFENTFGKLSGLESTREHNAQLATFLRRIDPQRFRSYLKAPNSPNAQEDVEAQRYGLSHAPLFPANSEPGHNPGFSFARSVHSPPAQWPSSRAKAVVPLLRHNCTTPWEISWGK